MCYIYVKGFWDLAKLLVLKVGLVLFLALVTLNPR